MFTKLYNKCLKLAAHKNSNYFLGAISFIESSFFPIPPDVMIAPMAIAKKQEFLKIFLVATIFSVLGGIQVGGSAVVIREFSKEDTFAANSNNIVPTQKAIKSYIESRISGGGSNASTNTLIAGQIQITGTTISTTSGFPINFTPRVNMSGGFTGSLLAQQYMMLGVNTQFE